MRSFEHHDNTLFLRPYEWISLGGSMTTLGEKIQPLEYIPECDYDAGGLYYNREFFYVIAGIANYNNNAAYSREIDDYQLSVMIDTFKRYPHYNILANNCSQVAGRTWDAVFSQECVCPHLSQCGTPNKMKFVIQQYPTSKQVSLYSILLSWN